MNKNFVAGAFLTVFSLFIGFMCSELYNNHKQIKAQRVLDSLQNDKLEAIHKGYRDLTKDSNCVKIDTVNNSTIIINQTNEGESIITAPVNGNTIILK